MDTASITPLELQGVAHRFGRKVVLRRIDLRVEPREIVGLMGANGAGKTTLLTIIAGLLQPNQGERRFGSHPGPGVGLEQRARMAFVAHTTQLYPRLTARENLGLFSDLRIAAGVEHGGSEIGIDLLERMGLGEVIDRPVSTYSRGMVQRVVLARALCGRPDLLLLDEPYTALDSDGRALVTEVLRAEKERGASVLLSAHDMTVVADATDRAVRLEDGLIVGEVERITAEDPEGAGYFERLSTLAAGRSTAEERPSA